MGLDRVNLPLQTTWRTHPACRVETLSTLFASMYNLHSPARRSNEPQVDPSADSPLEEIQPCS